MQIDIKDVESGDQLQQYLDEQLVPGVATISDVQAFLQNAGISKVFEPRQYSQEYEDLSYSKQWTRDLVFDTWLGCEFRAKRKFICTWNPIKWFDQWLAQTFVTWYFRPYFYFLDGVLIKTYVWQYGTGL